MDFQRKYLEGLENRISGIEINKLCAIFLFFRTDNSTALNDEVDSVISTDRNSLGTSEEHYSDLEDVLETISQHQKSKKQKLSFHDEKKPKGLETISQPQKSKKRKLSLQDEKTPKRRKKT